jgi:hypothetical protein
MKDMTYKRYFPTKHVEFNQFFKNIIQYMGSKATEWKHIPKDVQDALADEYGDWYTAYAPTLKPHNPLENKAKRDAYAQAARHLRLFINQYLRFPPVTAQDRLAMGIPNPDFVRTRHGPPTEEVEYTLRQKGRHKVSVYFKVLGAQSRAKPAGYHGAIIAYDVLDNPPQRYEELTRRVTATRTPCTLEFDVTERGKAMYAALHWQNRRGNDGAWSKIQSEIVP